MLGNSIEIKFEEVKEGQEKIRIFTVIGKSMSKILKQFTDVLVREKGPNYEYKKGDIIAFKQGGSRIIHQIEDIFTCKGKTYYITKGTNNQFVDNALVSRENILGLADLSKEGFASINEILASRQINRHIAFGLTEDLTPDEALSKVIEEFDDDGQSFSNVYGGTSDFENGMYIRGSETMKQLIINEDLNQFEVILAILKNLMDSKLVEILKEENPDIYGDLKPNEYNRIIEALGIDKEIQELTDADIMDIARKRFKWGDWDNGKNGNVAYIHFKVKIGGITQTMIYFARSGSQDLGGISENNEIWRALEGFKRTLWDSERKIFIAFLDKININLDQIDKIEFTAASENGFCSNCKSIILRKLVDYITRLKERKNIENTIELFRILRNEGPPTDRGVRNPVYNKNIFKILKGKLFIL